MSVRFTRRSSSLSRFQTFVALLATSAVVATTASATWAQGQNPANRPRPGGNQPMREQVTGAGKIKGMQGGVMQVVGSGGEQYLVALEAPQNAQQASQVQVSFQGKAEPSWLKPGMLLRFQNKVDKRGRLLDPIDSLEVLSPRPDLQVGILPASGLDKEGGGGGGLFQDVPEKTEKPGKKAPPADMTPVSVVVPLREYRSGKISFMIGSKLHKVELAEGASIAVDIADLSHVRADDSIEFRGWVYPMMKQQVHANQITITSKQPLANEKKRPPMPGEKGEKSEKSEKPEKSDKPEKAADDSK